MRKTVTWMRQHGGWRKVGFLFLGPLLVEMLVALYAYWMVLQSTNMGVVPKQLMLLPMCGALGYGVASYALGRRIRETQTTGYLLGAVLMIVVIGTVAVTVCDAFHEYCVMAVLLGGTVGHYYVPFQINMQRIQPFKTLAWMVAAYNVSWSTGVGLGTFLSAWVRGYAHQGIVLVSVGVGLMTAHTALLMLSQKTAGKVEKEETASVFNSTEAQRKMGWIALIIVGVTLSGVSTVLWPALGKIREWTDREVGYGAFMLWAVIPVTAPLFAVLRKKLEKPGMMVGALILGGVSLLGIQMTDALWVGVCCMGGMGLMQSAVAYHAIYYANSDAVTKHRSLGMLEGLTGAGSFMGPLILGSIAGSRADWVGPYVAGTAALIAAAGIIGWMWMLGMVDENRVQPR